MAGRFQLTAELNVQAPANLSAVASQLQQQLNGITATVQVKVPQGTNRSFSSLNTVLGRSNTHLTQFNQNMAAAIQNLNNFGTAVNRINNVTTNLNNVNRAAQQTAKTIQGSADSMTRFGEQAGLALRRYAAFTVAAGTVFKFSQAVREAFTEAISFQREVVRLSQVTQKTVREMQPLVDTITSLATGFGVASKELVGATRILAQAGLTADETATALKTLAKTELAPTFDNIIDSTEGAIAVMRQFQREGETTAQSLSRLEKNFGAINLVSAQFAVESEDIIAAVRRTGGAFAAAGGDFEQFIALFTSVRQTTRESAETIATGFRTIFTRLQRNSTIDFLKQFGINLSNLEGKFVGPFEAVKRLQEGLKGLDSTDIRFSQIIEELGGYRQISKVIPLIQQFGVAQKAYAIALQGQFSLNADVIKSQDALTVQITKVKEEFLDLFRTITNNKVMQEILQDVLALTKGIIQLTKALEPVLPALTAFAGIKVLGSVTKFGRSAAQTVIGRAGGGYVPGSGDRDTVPAMLTPGEYVIRKKAVQAIGVDKLEALNKYAVGGIVKMAKAGVVPRAKRRTKRNNALNSVDNFYGEGSDIVQERFRAGIERGFAFRTFYEDFDAELDKILGKGKKGQSIKKRFLKFYTAQSFKQLDASAIRQGVAMTNHYQKTKSKNVEEYLYGGLEKFRRPKVERALKGKFPDTNKLSVYGRALSGDTEAIPVDSNVIQTALGRVLTKQDKKLGIGKVASKGPDPNIDFLRDEVKKAAKHFNITPRQAQAAIYAGFHGRSKLDEVLSLLYDNETKTGVKYAGLKPVKFANAGLVKGIIGDRIGDVSRNRRRRLTPSGELTPQAKFYAQQRNVRFARRFGKQQPEAPGFFTGALSEESFAVGNARKAARAFSKIVTSKEQRYQQYLKYIPNNSQYIGSGAEAFTARRPDGLVARVQLGKVNRPNIKGLLQPKVSKYFEDDNITVEILPYAPSLESELQKHGLLNTDNIEKFRKSIASHFEHLFGQQGYFANDIRPSNVGVLGGGLKKGGENQLIVTDPGFIRMLRKQDAENYATFTGSDALKYRAAGKGLLSGKSPRTKMFRSPYAAGGEVDSVPALLTPGEYVINKKAAKKIGLMGLNYLNNIDKKNMGGPVQMFASGGHVQKFAGGTQVRTVPALGLGYQPQGTRQQAGLAIYEQQLEQLFKNIISATNPQLNQAKKDSLAAAYVGRARKRQVDLLVDVNKNIVGVTQQTALQLGLGKRLSKQYAVYEAAVRKAAQNTRPGQQFGLALPNATLPSAGSKLQQYKAKRQLNSVGAQNALLGASFFLPTVLSPFLPQQGTAGAVGRGLLQGGATGAVVGAGIYSGVKRAGGGNKLAGSLGVAGAIGVASLGVGDELKQLATQKELDAFTSAVERAGVELENFAKSGGKFTDTQNALTSFNTAADNAGNRAAFDFSTANFPSTQGLFSFVESAIASIAPVESGFRSREEQIKQAREEFVANNSAAFNNQLSGRAQLLYQAQAEKPLTPEQQAQLEAVKKQFTANQEAISLQIARRQAPNGRLDPRDEDQIKADNIKATTEVFDAMEKGAAKADFAKDSMVEFANSMQDMARSMQLGTIALSDISREFDGAFTTALTNLSGTLSAPKFKANTDVVNQLGLLDAKKLNDSLIQGAYGGLSGETAGTITELNAAKQVLPALLEKLTVAGKIGDAPSEITKSLTNALSEAGVDITGQLGRSLISGLSAELGKLPEADSATSKGQQVNKIAESLLSTLEGPAKEQFQQALENYSKRVEAAAQLADVYGQSQAKLNAISLKTYDIAAQRLDLETQFKTQNTGRIASDVTSISEFQSPFVGRINRLTGQNFGGAGEINPAAIGNTIRESIKRATEVQGLISAGQVNPTDLTALNNELATLNNKITDNKQALEELTDATKLNAPIMQRLADLQGRRDAVKSIREGFVFGSREDRQRLTQGAKLTNQALKYGIESVSQDQRGILLDFLKANGQKGQELIDYLVGASGEGQKLSDQNVLPTIMGEIAQLQKDAITNSQTASTALNELLSSEKTAADAFYKDAITSYNTIIAQLSSLGGVVPLAKSTGGVVYAAGGFDGSRKGYDRFGNTLFQPRGTDTVPAMLTPGEFVINRASSRQYKDILRLINNDKNGNYADLLGGPGVIKQQGYGNFLGGPGIVKQSGYGNFLGGVGSIRSKGGYPNLFADGGQVQYYAGGDFVAAKSRFKGLPPQLLDELEFFAKANNINPEDIIKDITIDTEGKFNAKFNAKSSKITLGRNYQPGALSHELGHGLDYDPVTGKYRSDTPNSPENIRARDFAKIRDKIDNVFSNKQLKSLYSADKLPREHFAGAAQAQYLVEKRIVKPGLFTSGKLSKINKNYINSPTRVSPVPSDVVKPFDYKPNPRLAKPLDFQAQRTASAANQLDPISRTRSTFLQNLQKNRVAQLKANNVTLPSTPSRFVPNIGEARASQFVTPSELSPPDIYGVKPRGVAAGSGVGPNFYGSTVPLEDTPLLAPKRPDTIPLESSGINAANKYAGIQDIFKKGPVTPPTAASAAPAKGGYFPTFGPPIKATLQADVGSLAKRGFYNTISGANKLLNKGKAIPGQIASGAKAAAGFTDRVLDKTYYALGAGGTPSKVMTPAQYKALQNVPKAPPTGLQTTGANLLKSANLGGSLLQTGAGINEVIQAQSERNTTNRALRTAGGAGNVVSGGIYTGGALANFGLFGGAGGTLGTAGSIAGGAALPATIAGLGVSGLINYNTGVKTQRAYGAASQGAAGSEQYQLSKFDRDRANQFTEKFFGAQSGDLITGEKGSPAGRGAGINQDADFGAVLQSVQAKFRERAQAGQGLPSQSELYNAAINTSGVKITDKKANEAFYRSNIGTYTPEEEKKFARKIDRTKRLDSLVQQYKPKGKTFEQTQKEAVGAFNSSLLSNESSRLDTEIRKQRIAQEQAAAKSYEQKQAKFNAATDAPDTLAGQAFANEKKNQSEFNSFAKNRARSSKNVQRYAAETGLSVKDVTAQLGSGNLSDSLRKSVQADKDKFAVSKVDRENRAKARENMDVGSRIGDELRGVNTSSKYYTGRAALPQKSKEERQKLFDEQIKRAEQNRLPGAAPVSSIRTPREKPVFGPKTEFTPREQRQNENRAKREEELRQNRENYQRKKAGLPPVAAAGAVPPGSGAAPITQTQPQVAGQTGGGPTAMPDFAAFNTAADKLANALNSHSIPSEINLKVNDFVVTINGAQAMNDLVNKLVLKETVAALEAKVAAIDAKLSPTAPATG